jgi:hypothetical protein
MDGKHVRMVTWFVLDIGLISYLMATMLPNHALGHRDGTSGSPEKAPAT